MVNNSGHRQIRLVFTLATLTDKNIIRQSAQLLGHTTAESLPTDVLQLLPLCELCFGFPLFVSCRSEQWSRRYHRQIVTPKILIEGYGSLRQEDYAKRLSSDKFNGRGGIHFAVRFKESVSELRDIMKRDITIASAFLSAPERGAFPGVSKTIQRCEIGYKIGFCKSQTCTTIGLSYTLFQLALV